jgi:hypothetical protein
MGFIALGMLAAIIMQQRQIDELKAAIIGMSRSTIRLDSGKGQAYKGFSNLGFKFGKSLDQNNENGQGA